MIVIIKVKPLKITPFYVFSKILNVVLHVLFRYQRLCEIISNLD